MTYTYCTGEGCPMKEQCKAFKPDMNKRTTDHWGKPPIKPNGECHYFDPKDEIDQLLDNIKNDNNE